MQRGNSSDPGQFRIQMDHGVPSCRFAGDGGEVFVEADSAVHPAGVPVASADQFNGAVDDVYVRIG